MTWDIQSICVEQGVDDYMQAAIDLYLDIVSAIVWSVMAVLYCCIEVIQLV